MWWECSECGGLIERRRPPVKCRHCGTAGVYFVPADVREPSEYGDAEELRSGWLARGLERARVHA
jgi:hypothetical protein